MEAKVETKLLRNLDFNKIDLNEKVSFDSLAQKVSQDLASRKKPNVLTNTILNSLSLADRK